MLSGWGLIAATNPKMKWCGHLKDSKSPFFNVLAEVANEKAITLLLLFAIN